MTMMMGQPMMMSRPYYYGYGYADDPIPHIPYGSNSLFITNYGNYNQYDITQGGIQGSNGNLQPVRWP